MSEKTDWKESKPEQVYRTLEKSYGDGTVASILEIIVGEQKGHCMLDVQKAIFRSVGTSTTMTGVKPGENVTQATTTTGDQVQLAVVFTGDEPEFDNVESAKKEADRLASILKSVE